MQRKKVHFKRFFILTRTYAFFLPLLAEITFLFSQKKYVILSLLSITVIGCTPRTSLAPVVELKWANQGLTAKKHTVERGETLYAIAFRHDKDYRDLAKINGLHPPYTLRVGQVVRLNPKPIASKPNPKSIVKSPQAHPDIKVKKLVHHIKASNPWVWPVKGSILDPFEPKRGKKGINIAGHKHDKIRSASDGIVAYSGNGLAGYGNLIIIKHDNQFLTAYGNNARNLVREGQQVKKGQVIAKMGRLNRKQWGVHFEIRKVGQPVNPLKYLQKA